MVEMAKKPEVSEIKSPTVENYKEIKPQDGMTPKEARAYWDDSFKNIEPSAAETSEKKDESYAEAKKTNDGKTDRADNIEQNLEQTIDEYFKDLKDKSECPETIPDRPFGVFNLEKLSPEEVAKRREEFDDVKADLKKQWEEEHGTPWPKYEHDVYSANGKLIRKAGSDYDAHHIQPLGMGGKNEVKNITPLNAEVHYDKQGVHSLDSPYTKMDKILGGIGS